MAGGCSPGSNDLLRAYWARLAEGAALFLRTGLAESSVAALGSGASGGGKGKKTKAKRTRPPKGNGACLVPRIPPPSQTQGTSHSPSVSPWNPMMSCPLLPPHSQTPPPAGSPCTSFLVAFSAPGSPALPPSPPVPRPFVLRYFPKLPLPSLSLPAPARSCHHGSEFPLLPINCLPLLLQHVPHRPICFVDPLPFCPLIVFLVLSPGSPLPSQPSQALSASSCRLFPALQARAVGWPPPLPPPSSKPGETPPASGWRGCTPLPSQPLRPFVPSRHLARRWSRSAPAPATGPTSWSSRGQRWQPMTLPPPPATGSGTITMARSETRPLSLLSPMFRPAPKQEHGCRKQSLRTSTFAPPFECLPGGRKAPQLQTPPPPDRVPPLSALFRGAAHFPSMTSSVTSHSNTSIPFVRAGSYFRGRALRGSCEKAPPAFDTSVARSLACIDCQQSVGPRLPFLEHQVHLLHPLFAWEVLCCQALQ